MSQERKPTLGFFVAVAIVAVLATPFLYAVLTGPIVFLAVSGVIGDESVEMFFAPLDSADDFLPEWANACLEDYIHWWASLTASP